LLLIVSIVRRERPQVKVVLASGAVRKADVAGELCEDGPLLSKPYDPAEVIRHIQLLLNRGT
jgi:hypothetical protein